ncbi:Ankyrin repeat and zinc finger domain-containing protein 1 [Picochlorum sp. SENEW3]|nr:Ankyrin repeat and zinc finger domain-containing protein 1 [Picochlorum sp. SENEW3]
MPLILEPFSTVFSISDYQCQSTSSTADGSNEEEAAHIDASISEKISSLTLDAYDAPGAESTRSNDDALEPCAGRKTCVTCGIAAFEDDLEQRIHFKTDWHRFNVKLRALNKKPVLKEEDFNALVEQGGGGLDDDVGSISGSDDDVSDDDELERVQDASLLAPYITFRVRSIRDGTTECRLAVWKCLLMPSSSRSDHAKNLDPIECVQRLVGMKKEAQQWAVIMFQGGHFAACVYSIESPSENVLQRTDRASHEIAELSMTEIAHKSFHRYVVRAKAGGKQSDKDATGKVAKSAGSRLRRYNEAMLKKQVVETLNAWKDNLSNCNLIFVSCPGSNRLVLFGGDAPPLDKNDERIRKVPFMTRRPTISETKRVVRTLLTMYKYTPKQIHREDKVERKEEHVESHKPDTEERRRAEKLELQKQQLMAQERNKKKKERRKEQKRASRMKETQLKEGEDTEGKEDEPKADSLDAALKSLAAAASESTMKRSMADQKKPPQSKEKARSKKNSESIATRREKLAAAAEARAKALAAASSSQKLW